MPAINSRSERGSVQLSERSLLGAAVRGSPASVPVPKGRTERSRIAITSTRDREFDFISLCPSIIRFAKKKSGNSLG